ncbi:MAG TPA: hypothetical protein VGJ36_11670 [Gemmatimonadales bacterium]
MTDHPLYRMWKDRLDADLAAGEARARRRAAREAELADWHEAWRTYKARRTELGEPVPTPRWWDVLGWIRWVLRLHAPGRPN